MKAVAAHTYTHIHIYPMTRRVGTCESAYEGVGKGQCGRTVLVGEREQTEGERACMRESECVCVCVYNVLHMHMASPMSANAIHITCL